MSNEIIGGRDIWAGPEDKSVAECPFGQHEALHVAWMIEDMFDRYLVEHPAVRGDAKLYAKALKVHEALCGFYQEVGNIRKDQKRAA